MFTNRLADSTSPYLLQHAHNPVDWYPWGREAIARARREDKPIFLSIGYSACHWCHVMEREVFENAEIAAFMNEHFINIKVDREERPDLDDLYMLATQIMSGSGGWPMSVWLTPDLQPFYAGTYFPPNDAYGRPGFSRLEKALADAWKNRRPELLDQAQKVVEAIQQHTDESVGGTPAKEGDSIEAGPRLAAAVEQSADRFDRAHGGLGSAPKFPPHQALHLWLSMLERTEALGLSHANQELLRELVTGTLDGMMRGGIYDHVGGGFARYSTDARWLVPHFEKMLYDNAQLAPAYARAAALLNRTDYARIARQTLDFWLHEMTADSGAFYSSLDADSEGVEGKFYVWTPADIRSAVQSDEDAQFLIEYFGLTDVSNWHESPVDGASVLAQGQSPEAMAQKYAISPDAVLQRLDSLSEQLRDYRAKRPAPGLDDKVLTSWNALMISGLAICGRLLGEPRYSASAKRAAEFLLTVHMRDHNLLRVSRHGKAHTDAFLDDHAYLLNALLDLADAGIDLHDRAGALADTLLREFQDADHGGFSVTGPRHEQLFARMKHAADNATPSANGMAIRALLRFADRVGNDEYRAAAQRAVVAFGPAIQRRAEYFPTILQALVESASIEPAGKAPDVHPGLETNSPVFNLSGTATMTGMDLVVLLKLTIAAGYHADPAQLAARVRGDFPLTSQRWAYPPPLKEGYVGTIQIRGDCAVPPDEKIAPGRYMLRTTIEAQPCSDTACLASQTLTAEIPLLVP